MMLNVNNDGDVSSDNDNDNHMFTVVDDPDVESCGELWPGSS